MKYLLFEIIFTSCLISGIITYFKLLNNCNLGFNKSKKFIGTIDIEDIAGRTLKPNQPIVTKRRKISKEKVS